MCIMIHNTITANAKAFEKNWPSSNQPTHRRYSNCPQGTQWAWWFVFTIFARHKTHFHIWRTKVIETYCEHLHWKGLRPRWWLCSLMYSLIKCKKNEPTTLLTAHCHIHEHLPGPEHCVEHGNYFNISSWKRKLCKRRRASEIRSKFFLEWQFRQVN